MMRPVTCLSLIAALGAGLFLYQSKHDAAMLDRDIARALKQADQARDRAGLLRAEWALLNEPDRLTGLAAAHLPQLQPLQPTQFARMEDLPGRLPAVSAQPVEAPPAMEPPPVAAATPPAPPALVASAPQAAPASAALKPVQVASARPLPRALPAAKPREEWRAVAAARPAETPRPLLAPVMPAYSPAPVVIHAPTLQTASAYAPSTYAPPPYVGSALGMAHSALPAPVPVSSSGMGYASGQ